jgi:hypothetical protein
LTSFPRETTFTKESAHQRNTTLAGLWPTAVDEDPVYLWHSGRKRFDFAWEIRGMPAFVAAVDSTA